MLQLCYGMQSGYPAVLTPQLMTNCSDFTINEVEESWIGKEFKKYLHLNLFVEITLRKVLCKPHYGNSHLEMGV